MADADTFLHPLLSGGFECVIVGEFAAAAHGVLPFTLNLELCCPFTPENLRRLASALEPLHPRYRRNPERTPFVLTDDLLFRLYDLYLQTDLGQLDCLSEVKGVGDFAEVRRQSIEVELPAGPCRILSLDALIRAKEAMGGPKDKLTILQLKAIQERTQTH
jgi:hypothetical protein